MKMLRMGDSETLILISRKNMLSCNLSSPRRLNFSRSCIFCFELLIGLLLTLLPASTYSQTNKAPDGNRFLLVVEISKSMGQRGNGALHAIQHLLASGMAGQIRDGDTLGVWTYNTQLYTGRFPLQHWSAENHNNTAQKALVFVQAQTCEKRGNLDLVMPALQKLAKSSRVLTVVLVSDGQQKIRGTDFDEGINKLYDTWRVEQEKARMPLITVLRAVHGKWTDFRVNAAPWPVEMPPLPKNAGIVGNVEKKVSPPPTPPPRSTTNLFLYGKTLSNVERKPEIPVTNSAIVPGPVAGALSANASPAGTIPNATVITSRPEPTQTVTQSVALSPTISHPAEPPRGPSEQGGSPDNTLTKSDLVPAQPELVKSLAQDPPVSTHRSLEKNPAEALQANSQLVTELKNSDAPANTNSSERIPSSSAKRISSASLATVIQSPTGARSKFSVRSLIILTALIVAAASLLLLWARNYRANNRVSLITRSLNKRE